MNADRPLALVTGASSGIGLELALGLARKGYDLLLTGRDAGRLGEAAGRVQDLGGRAEARTLDLADHAALGALIEWVGSRSLEVLVNNAGIGLSGDLIEEDPKAIAAMIQLNVTSLTLLTRALLPAMVARGRGYVLNIASTGAFQPCPGMAAYCATKAYVLSFSEAVAEEVAGTGVVVTALCPGPTATRFAERASMGRSALFKSAGEPSEVARVGLQALFAGRTVRVVGFSRQLMAFSVRFSPRRVAAKLAKLMLRKDP